jgi:SAM-dependent methyltransferase
MVDIIQKTRDDYNKIARHFSSTRAWAWPEWEQFRPYVKDGQCIMDWGCGNGRLISFLKSKDIRYYGLDISQGLLKFAKKNHQTPANKGKVSFFCTAHREKKFKDDFFDLVFMVASFHHLPDKKTRLNLLKKTYRELKAGGFLLMSVWNLESKWAKKKLIRSSKSGWKKLADNDFMIPWKSPEGKIEVERYYHNFSKTEIEELLKSAGFKIVKNDYCQKTNWTDGKEGRNLVIIAEKV